mmetsp:Transcript_3420/g.10791  ORF Transcript_3420/g.10791 Transcript_3420/m.10791 type:complete len:210 (+) Transcript_3420:131-760(+)
MLSSPMDAMRPPQRLPGSALPMEMEISGSIPVPSSAEKVRVSGTQAPRRTHDQTTRPKAVIVAVADVTSTTMAAAGCPRRPGINSLAAIRSAVSSHLHPLSSLPGRREVLSQPLVAMLLPPARSGSGFSRSSIVRPRSDTSIVSDSSGEGRRRKEGAPVAEPTRGCIGTMSAPHDDARRAARRGCIHASGRRLRPTGCCTGSGHNARPG